MKALWNRIVAGNRLDARALGIFRIALGLILVVKFWGTVPRNFEQVFSPTTGLLGNCFAEGYEQAYRSAGPLFAMRSEASLWAFVIAAGAVMLAFTIGFYPRLMAAIGSVMLWMFNERFQMLWFGWEQYAQVLLFLAIFLPVGGRFACFKTKPAPEPASDAVSGPFVFLMLFQVAMIYGFNGFSKNGDLWLDGTAVQFSLGADAAHNGLAAWLIRQDLLCKLLTYLTLAWELALPFLLFIPSRNAWLRTAAAVSIPAFHWGLSLFMDVGDFRYVAIPVMALLLPAAVWERLPAFLARWSRMGIRLPSWPVPVPRALNMVVAGLLVAVIVGSNLKMSLLSRSEDRIKAILGGGAFQDFITAVVPDGLPRYSFFAQHWHLFSPNPPSELGEVRIEMAMPDGRVTPIFAGEEDVEAYPTKTVRFLMRYLSYDRENRKAEVFVSCMTSREAHLWHEAHKGSQARRLSLMLYSWRPSTLDALKAGPPSPAVPHELVGLNFRYDPSQP